MTCSITTDFVELNRQDRDYLAWPVQNFPDGGTASIRLEGTGAWTPMTYLDGELVVLFAGSTFPSPGSTPVVAVTSHCEIRIVSGNVSITLDAGFIRLVN